MTRTVDIDVHHVTRVEGHGSIRVRASDGTIEQCEWRVPEAPRFFRGHGSRPELRGHSDDREPHLRHLFGDALPRRDQGDRGRVRHGSLGTDAPAADADALFGANWRATRCTWAISRRRTCLA